MSKKKSSFDFEASLVELETLVERMEQGELPLEEALKQFEQGIKLTRACQLALQEAEQKVQVLVEQDGKEQLQPFTESEA